MGAVDRDAPLEDVVDRVLLGVRVPVLDAVSHVPVDGVPALDPILSHPRQLGAADPEVSESSEGLDVSSEPVLLVRHLAMNQDVPGQQTHLGLHVQPLVDLAVVHEVDFPSN